MSGAAPRGRSSAHSRRASSSAPCSSTASPRAPWRGSSDSRKAARERSRPARRKHGGGCWHAHRDRRGRALGGPRGKALRGAGGHALRSPARPEPHRGRDPRLPAAGPPRREARQAARPLLPARRHQRAVRARGRRDRSRPRGPRPHRRDDGLGARGSGVRGGADRRIPQGGRARARSHARARRVPEHGSRPVDEDRDGVGMGEGAAVLVLEERVRALARGAKIYAEIVGYGFTNDAYHMTAPRPDGSQAARAIRLGLADAGVAPTEDGYVNAHGSSTPLNDSTETAALKQVFGEHAYRLTVSGTKGYY